VLSLSSGYPTVIVFLLYFIEALLGISLDRYLYRLSVSFFFLLSTGVFLIAGSSGAKYSSIIPPRFEVKISATILSFNPVRIFSISSLDKSSGKKSKTVSKLPESILSP